jgi:D-amino-acid dehydrogenase
MKTLVLGAGVIGVSTAYFLRQQGVDVTVIDRQAGAARETSFANGCQISVSFSEPWATPSAPLKILRWLGKEDAPLLFRLRFEPAQWAWGLAFLRECLPGRMAHNVAAMVSLSAYSRSMLQQVRADAGIEYDHLERGILRFFTDPADFADAQPAADRMRELGVNRRVIDADECVRIEPALASFRSKLVGGDYTADDESGDIHKFTVALAQRAEANGVQFAWGNSVTRLLLEGGRVTGVELLGSDGVYRIEKADAVVVATASHAPELLATAGIRGVRIYPAKGYSATYRITDPERAPTVSLTDEACKIVFSRLGDRLRVAGTAELNGYTRDLNPVRCEALTRRARELFPGVCDFEQPQYWTGLRPSTPSNVPMIGRTKVQGLWLNAGHGTLGWTMGVGSGAVLADLMAGRTPPIAFPFQVGSS